MTLHVPRPCKVCQKDDSCTEVHQEFRLLLAQFCQHLRHWALHRMESTNVDPTNSAAAGALASSLLDSS